MAKRQPTTKLVDALRAEVADNTRRRWIDDVPKATQAELIAIRQAWHEDHCGGKKAAFVARWVKDKLQLQVTPQSLMRWLKENPNG